MQVSVFLTLKKLRGGADVEGSWAWFQSMIEEDRLTEFMSTTAAAMENTITSSFTNLGNSWNMVKTMIVTSVREDLMDAFNGLAELIWNIGYAIRDNPALGRFVAYFAGIIGAVTTLVGGLMVLSGTILLIARAFHTLGGMVGPVLQMMMVLPSILATMAPAFLLLAAAATALYVAWEYNLGGIQDIYNRFISNFTWENVLLVLADVISYVEQLGRAFHELIGGVMMGAFTGPFTALQETLQDLMGVPLGNRAFVELVELGAQLQENFAEARAGESGGLIGSIVRGAERATTVIKNLSGSVRAFSELLVFGQTTQAGGQALTALGSALGIADPLIRAAQAADALRVALAYLQSLVGQAIGEWQQFFNALSQSTSLTNVLSTVFTSLAAAVMGFAVGFITAIGRVATLGSLAMRTISEGVDGLVTRMRTAAATLSSGGGLGQTIARGMQVAANALERFGGIIDRIQSRFQKAGVSIQAIAAAVGGTIGAAMGIRLVAMLTPGLGILARLGTMIGQVGIYAVQAAAQFALLGARLAVAFATAVVQIGLLIVQLGISAGAWAIETLARLTNAGAALTQTAANTGLMASLVALAGDMIFSAIATGSLTGAFLALDVAAAPFLAIAAAIVLVVVALPAAFFATAAAIFVVVSATDGLRAGFSAMIDFFQAFWAVASQLRFAFIALVGAVRLAIAPIQQLMGMFGANLHVVEILGYAFGALALVIGTALVGAVVAAAMPFLAMAAVIYVAIKAIEALVTHWGTLYDAMASVLGGLDSIVESSFNYVGEKIDWLIAKIEPLISALDRLASFAGIDINVSEDGRSVSIGVPGSDSTMGVSTGDLGTVAGGLLAGGPLGAFAAIGGKKAGDYAYDQVIVPFANDFSDAMVAGVKLGGQQLHDFLMTTFSSAALTIQSFGTYDYNDPALSRIWSPTDVAYFNEDPSRYAPYQMGYVDNVSRPYDPEGRLSGADRYAISQYADLVEDVYGAARYNNQPISSASIKNALKQQLPQGAYDDATATYVVEQAYQAGINQFTNTQQQALTTLDEIQSSSAFMPAYGQAPGAAATAVTEGQGIAAVGPAPVVQPDRSMWQTAGDLIGELVGGDSESSLMDFFESFGLDFESGTLTGLEVMDAAFYNPDTSWMMEAMFPGYNEYQQQMTEYGKYQAMLKGLGGNMALAEQEWYASYGTAPPTKPDVSVMYGTDTLQEGQENAEEFVDTYKQFMESVMQATRDTYLAQDIGSGMRAVFGNVSAGGAMGTFAETIMGNIDEEVLKANPWFNQDELMANAAIYGGRGQAMQGVAGKNLHDALGPMLQRTADELGVTVDSLLADVPTYYFDPKYMATAQTAMFSALSNLGPRQGELLDMLGMNPDDNGRVFEEMGLDFAELTQYAISNAMAGNDWNLSHYLMDAWDITQAEAEDYIRDNGLDPNVVNSSMFQGIEAAVLSSNGQVAAMTEDWGNWLAEVTENGLDPVIDISRAQFEKIPEAYRIAMSNMGYTFNILNDTNLGGAVAAAEASVNQMITSYEGLGTVWDAVGGEADNFFNALNDGSIEAVEQADGSYNLISDMWEGEINVPGLVWDDLQESLWDIENAAKDAYDKYKGYFEGSGHEVGDTGQYDTGLVDPVTGERILEERLSYDEWRAKFWEDMKDGGMTESDAAEGILGFDMSTVATYMHEQVVAMANDMQGSFARSMASDTQISGAIEKAFTNAFATISVDSGMATTAATQIATNFKSAIAAAFAGGFEGGAGSEVWGSADMYTGGAAEAAPTGVVQGIIDNLITGFETATIDVSGFVTNLQTALQSGMDTVDIDLSTFGTTITASATEWGTTAGTAFATAFAAAAVITGGGPQGQAENGETPGRDGGQGTAGADTSSTTTVTLVMDTTQFMASYNTVTQIMIALDAATMSADIKLDTTTWFNPTAQLAMDKLTTLNAYIAIPQIMLQAMAFDMTYNAVMGKLDLLSGRVATPSVSLIDGASSALVNINSMLDSVNRTVTATVNIVTNGSVPKVPGMASGGLATGGMTLVGEEGPEFVDLPPGSRVFGADATRTMMSDTSMLSASPFTNTRSIPTQTTNNVSISVQINNPSVRNDDDIDRLASAVSRKLGKEFNAMLNGQRPRN